MSKRCVGCMKLKEKSPVCEHCGYNEYVPNEPHQLPIGTVLQGRYQIGKVLGQGGFGITYIGWDLSLETVVAIKEFYPGSIVNRDCSVTRNVACNGSHVDELFTLNRDRFLREARILAKLSHVPGIVRVQNLFGENNTAYIVMEYVEGIDLKHYIRMQGRVLTVEETFAVMRPIMYALSRVHEAELVHRDISPDNILIQKDGSVVLLDFGAAREVANANVHKDLTRSTQTILKHGFAPIEQYRSRGNLGPWTDIYALCATMYYCLTGKVPSEAPERVIGEDNVNWRQIPGLTETQIAALEQGLAMIPEKRIQSVKELIERLYIYQNSTYFLDEFTPEESSTVTKEVPELAQNSITGYTVPSQSSSLYAHEKRIQENEIKQRQTTRKIGKYFVLATTVICTLLCFFIFINKENDPESNQIVEIIETKTNEENTSLPTEEKPLWIDNVLMEEKDYLDFWKEGLSFDETLEYIGNYSVLGSDIPRKNITSISFLDTLEAAPENSWDVSIYRNSTVLAWVEKKNEGFCLYIAGEGGVCAPRSCDSLFYGYPNLTEISFNGNFHTDYTYNMDAMFGYCKKLTYLNINSFDTSNVTSMNSMFISCSELRTLAVEGLNTSNVRDMSHMFGSTDMITNLNLNTWDVSRVSRHMNFMDYNDTINGHPWEEFFSRDKKAQTNTTWEHNLLMSAPDTKFTSIQKKEITAITFLDNLDNAPKDSWDVSKNQDGSVKAWIITKGQSKDLYIGANGGINAAYACNNLFYGYNNLKSIDFNSCFHTEEVTDMTHMFYNCWKLISLNLSNFDTSNVINMNGMFGNCWELTSLDLSAFDTSNVKNMNEMFTLCSKLTSLNLSNFDTTNVTNMNEMFKGCSSLTFLDLSNFNNCHRHEKHVLLLFQLDFSESL